MLSPGLRPVAPAGSALLSASTTVGARRRCAKPARLWWSPASRRSESPPSRHPRGRSCTRNSTPRARVCAKRCAHWATATSRRAERQRGRLPMAVHYPGTYLAGGYNRLRTDIAGRSVENEDLVNFPNWLALTFRIERRRLVRFARGCDSCLPAGARSQTRRASPDDTFRGSSRPTQHAAERRLVSMDDMHLAALELTTHGGELVGIRDRALGDRRPRGERRRKALSQVQQQTSASRSRAQSWGGRHLSRRTHLAVPPSCRASCAHTRLYRCNVD